MRRRRRESGIIAEDAVKIAAVVGALRSTMAAVLMTAMRSGDALDASKRDHSISSRLQCFTAMLPKRA